MKSTQLKCLAASALLILCLLAPSARADITTGLVGWWKMEGNVLDSSIYGNNGTLVGGVGFSMGKLGQALNFDGANTYVSVAKRLTVPLTVSAWVRLSDLSKTKNNLINTNAHTSLGISLNRLGAGETHVYIGNGAGWLHTPSISSSQNMVVNVWYHVVFTCNGAISNLFINSFNVGSSGDIPSGFGNLTYFGTIIIAGGEFYKGAIDDVRIYSRALSADDVMELYRRGGQTRIRNARLRNAIIR